MTFNGFDNFRQNCISREWSQEVSHKISSFWADLTTYWTPLLSKDMKSSEKFEQPQEVKKLSNTRSLRISLRSSEYKHGDKRLLHKLQRK